MKRILILILCAVLLAGSFCSCSELGEYSVNNRTVMTVGGIKVSYDMYKFCYNMAREEMGENTDFTKEENRVALKEAAEESVRLYCAQKLLFEKYGVRLTSEDKDEVDAEIQAYIDEQEGMAGYKKWLSENYISGEFFRSQIERMYYLDPYLREILFTGIDGLIPMDDETVLKDVNENFYRYTQIFIACDDDNYLDKRMKIDAAYDELQAGEKFSSVALKYSEWSANYERGVYTTKGEKLLEIEETALDLEISAGVDEGEYSAVIESYEGFHIIKRLPLDPVYIEDNLDDLGYISATRRYNELIAANAETLEVEYKEYYHTLTYEMLTEVEYA